MEETAAGTRPHIFKPFSLPDLKWVLEDAAL
jgi:hypothetical protein